jgi:hypothetical protein
MNCLFLFLAAANDATRLKDGPDFERWQSDHSGDSRRPDGLQFSTARAAKSCLSLGENYKRQTVVR